MKPSPEQHRKTLRLPQHDYAAGVYYITQATQHRQRLFGAIINGRVRLSLAGQMVHDAWHEFPRFCPAYAVDEFIVMPDHIHGIVRVDNRVDDAKSLQHHDYRAFALRRGAPPWASAANGVPTEGHPDGGNATLFDFVHRFKSLTTARYIHGVHEQQWPRFDGTLWQREYYEHIVRNDAAELRRIRAYIRDNPANANLGRFGDLRFYGNRALLALRKTAFLASRGAPPWAPYSQRVPTEGHPDRDRDVHPDRDRDVRPDRDRDVHPDRDRDVHPDRDRDVRPDRDRDVHPDYAALANAQCVISGFLSPLERDVLRFCRRRGIPTIHVLACGFREDAPLTEHELVATPFDPVAAVSQERAAWCNQYVLEQADEIIVGLLNPDGLLAFLLADLPRPVPATILAE